MILEVLADIVSGAITLMIVLGLKLLFEHTWGLGMERWIYAELQVALRSNTSTAQDITIVDISGIRPMPVERNLAASDESSMEATPREPLIALVQTILALKPRVIAIDLDFSAREGQAVNPHDPEYFRQFADLSEKYHVPVYLGVHRQRWEKPENWLGGAEFAKMAAGIAIPKEPETRYYVRWQRGRDAVIALPNLALALAGHANEAGQDIESRWSWAIQASQMRSAAPPYSGALPEGELAWALVDYSPLTALEGQFLRVVHKETLSDNPQRIERHAILLGDASEPQHHDHFNIGDLHPEPLAGVYLHACAALTAQGAPLRELTDEGRLVVDIGVSFIILLAITMLRLFYAWSRPAAEVQVAWLYGFLTTVAIIASCLFAVGLVRYTRVIWTDFTAVSVGLLLHLFLHHRIEHLPHGLSRWWNKHVVKSQPSDPG